MKCAILLALLLVSSVLAQGNGGSSSFTGTWTDTGGYGGEFFICQDGDNLYGMYTEFGLVVGKVTGNTFEGNWYEGGEHGDHCLYGPITMTVNGNSLDGSWQCGDEFFGDTFSFTESRESSQMPSDVQCARLANDGYLGAQWFSGEAVEGGSTVDLCLDDDGDYESSNIYGGTPEYEHGYFAEGGRVAGGAFYSQYGLGVIPGTSLWYTLETDVAMNAWWISTEEEPLPELLANDAVHGYDEYILHQGTSEGRCDRFEKLEDYYRDYYGYLDFWAPSPSAASYLVVPLLTLFISIVVFL